jgi:beta-lactamase regulating signal transducer with metallopeptidase domain
MFGSAASGLPGLLAGYLLRTTVVLALALAAAAAAKRRPAALRHFILSSALVGLLLLPALSLAPVGWRSPVVPAWMAPAPDRPGGGSAADDAGLSPKEPVAERPSGAAQGQAGGADGTTAAGFPLIVREGGPVGPPASSAADVPPGGATGPIAPAGPERAVVASGPRGRGLGLLIALIWSAGLAVLGLRLAVGLAGAARLTSEGTPLTGPAWRALLARFLALVSLRRAVDIKSHPEIMVPLTWGWRRPVVLLPADTESWSEEERSSALFHELSHIKRGDFLVMLLVRTSLAVFWWNPLGWAVYRQLLREQETACDELVLRAGIRPSSYAASLLAFRRSAGLRWSPSAALLGMLGRSSFQERLAAILKQQLVLREVKMKTKIMLALALVLAVALVGTARPVAGERADAAPTVIAETAAPATGAFEPAPAATAISPAPAEQTAAQAKEQELKKAKAAEKAAKEEAAAGKKIVIKSAREEGQPLEIVITEGDEVKTLVLDKPLTITTQKEGGALVLSVDGKEIKVLKGEPVRLAVKDGGIQVLKEGQAVLIGGKSGLKIVQEGGEEGRQIVFYGDAKPEVLVEAAPEVFMKLGKDVKPGEKWIQVSPTEGKEGQTVKIVKEGRPTLAWTMKESETDMLKKVRELQEQLEAVKAKKMDLSALEESLKKLEAELQANAEKLKEIGLKLEKSSGAFTVVKRIGEDEAEGKTGVWVVGEGQAADAARAKVMVGIGDKDERTISLVFTGQKGEAGQADYERVAAKLKKDLPAGYKIEQQNFDAENGAMTFKITAPEGGKTDEAFIRKLVDSVKDTLKSGK